MLRDVPHSTVTMIVGGGLYNCKVTIGVANQTAAAAVPSKEGFKKAITRLST